MLLPAMALACSPAPPPNAKPQQPIGGGCEGCELLYAGMPARATIGPDAILATTEEPGEPLVLSGIVRRPGGTAPAANVVLYFHHTDAQGLYVPAEGQRHARRHGRLRGWARTDAQGRFSLRTIRPAPYPDEALPAHIHIFVEEPGKNVYYIDEVRFLDDPLVTAAVRASDEGRGGDLNIAVARDGNGTWRGELHIELGRHIPHYR